jgi:hypothetical protein
MVLLAACAAGLLACAEQRKRLGEARAAEQAALEQQAKLRGRVASLQKDLAGLERARAADAKNLSELWLSLNRSQAAAAYLKTELGPQGVDPRSLALAEPRFRLQSAVEQGDVGVVNEMAGLVLSADGTCAGNGKARRGRGANGRSCEAQAGRIVRSPMWNCEKVEQNGTDGPMLAFCTAERVYKGPVARGDSWTLDGPKLPTRYDAIRTAFLHRGELHVADWPPPHLDAYFPPDVDAVEACRAEIREEKCSKKCQAQFASEIAGHLTGEEVESLSDGIEYCIEECAGTGAYAPRPDGPTSVERSFRLVESPAPGLLLVEEDLVLLAGEDVDSIETKTHLFINRAMLDVVSIQRVAAGREGRGNLGQLEKVATVYDERALAVAKERGAARAPERASKRVLAELDGVRALAGFDEDGVPRAYALKWSKAKPMHFEIGDFCARLSKLQEALGEAAEPLTVGCEQATKTDGTRAALIESLAKVRSGAALLSLRKELEAAGRSALIAKHRKELEALFADKTEEIGALELERIGARAGATSDQAGLKQVEDELGAILPLFGGAEDKLRELRQLMDKRKAVVARLERAAPPKLGPAKDGGGAP